MKALLSVVVARHGLVAKAMASNSPGNDRDNHGENTSGSENSRGEAGAANPEEQATQGDQNNNDVVSEEIVSEAEEDSALCFGPEESLDNNGAGTANTVDHVAPTSSFPFEQQGNPAEGQETRYIPQFNNLFAESMDRERDLEEAVGELIQLLHRYDVDVLDEGNIVQLSDSVTALGPTTRGEQVNNANTSHSGANLSSRNDGMKDEKYGPTMPEKGKRGPYKCPACGARKVETKDGVPIPHLCPELVEEVKVWAHKQDGKMSAEQLRDLVREAQRRMNADKDAPSDISSSRRASKDDPRRQASTGVANAVLSLKRTYLQVQEKVKARR